MPGVTGKGSWRGRTGYSGQQHYMIYDTFIIIHLSKPIEYKPPRVNPNVNYGLWRIMMCQDRFTDCNKCTWWGWGTLRILILGETGMGVVCRQGVYGNSVLSTQFYWEPKWNLLKMTTQCSSILLNHLRNLHIVVHTRLYTIVRACHLFTKIQLSNKLASLIGYL